MRPAWWRRLCNTKTLLVMKLTFVLLTAAFLNVSATGLSQNVSFSGKNVQLTRIFSEVEKQTGYVIVYTESTLAGTHPVSVQMKNVPLQEFLHRECAVGGERMIECDGIHR